MSDKTNRVLFLSLLTFCGLAGTHATGKENAPDVQESRLWLQYQAEGNPRLKESAEDLRSIYVPSSSSPILKNAVSELSEAGTRMLGHAITSDGAAQNGTVVLGTLAELKRYLPKESINRVASLNDEGYLIKSLTAAGKRITVITSRTDRGVLYGVFHFIRLMQTGESLRSLDLAEQPAVHLRMLNHWDNPDGSVERGYAGRSLWKWGELPEKTDPRYREYARFCASIGINGVVLNNVNADPVMMRSDYIEKTAALADIFRQWGIRTYLTPNFASPMVLSKNLNTADPMNRDVQAWWADKTDEIYQRIPDFGGFLIKADSEGQPGPKSYDRSHVEGANMLAEALEPHGGIVLWRAFVYGKSEDRAKDAYNEFRKFDGCFNDNVFLQIKNGPLDFQPREPFTPLFGAMPKTSIALELQITKEYLGHSTSSAYLAPMWEELLQTDTYAKGKGSTIARIVDGSLDRHALSCIAGVANIGDDANWCGSIFNQANWYAFGRLAWNPDLSAAAIADEWIRMTFCSDVETCTTIRKMMMGSYEACVDYTMPIGLNFLCNTGSHFKPDPAKRKAYHGADASGLGINRSKNGSDYSGQYAPELQAVFNDMDRIPLKYLLWFHHVPWDHTLSSGRTLLDELEYRYDRGVSYVDTMIMEWIGLKDNVDAEIHASVLEQLKKEQAWARTWNTTCMDYFSGVADTEK
ncbi:MAG: hypothetical protein JXR25_11480 [Pontiellaceae bacterium]|nr:hypothetical protein [Pontiellaceae bacterium]MBN2785435.1 hypothetical protein [Pontiellaceae bacterium]